jgi:tetratricopeptide (TPR) repeat protein
VIALVVLAGAGVVIYHKVSALVPEKGAAAVPGPSASAAAPAPPAPEPAPAPQGRAAEARPDEAPSWTHSAMVVIRSGNEGGGTTVVLGGPTGATSPGALAGVQKGLLARELVRQALLVAARDELGLATRDVVLGDAPPSAEGPGSVSADFGMILRSGGPASVKIVREGGETAGAVLEHDLLPPAPHHDLLELARAAEALSRTEFPQALRSLGLEGKAGAARSEGELAASVEKRLDSLGFVDPLAAVRALHAAIRSEGESPARLGALVRGYARLGVLNEFLWSPAHKAFEARALLYAQRLIARDPKSPWGLWHRAYALALVGLHQRALDDMAEADRLVQAGTGAGAGPKAPAWVVPLTAYCHFDLARLKTIGGPEQKLAAFLRMLALEFPHHSDIPLAAAGQVITQDPECFRAHDVMYKVGGVANLHVATMLAPQVLTQLVPKRIRAIETLPDGVRAAIDQGAAEPALVAALQQAGQPGEDTGEPSWAVLGSLIRETRFVHVEHRLYFMRRWWSVPVDEYWDEARPLVTGHRYQPYLLTLAIGTPQANQAFADAIGDALFADLELTEQPMIGHLDKLAGDKHSTAWKLAQQHMDHLVRDFATQCDLYSKDAKELWTHNANKILGLSPDNSYAMSLLVEADWDSIQPRLAEFEKKAADFPPLAGALGRRYSVLRQYEKARAVLEGYIRESPEDWAFERLAANYKEQGDLEHWLATLDRYLKEGSDHGLDKAKVRVEIANYYMSNKDWKKAQPYAEAAAATWAAWAMQCAVRCYSGLKDWPRAELWARRVSERYPSSAVEEWLNFCKQTGHGNRAAAQALVDQYRAVAGEGQQPVTAGRSGVDPALEAGFSSWLKGETQEATVSLRRAYDGASPLVAALALVALADDRGDTNQRDAILDDALARHRDKAPRMFDVLQIFRDALARGGRGTLDVPAIDRGVANVKANARGNTEFIVGWLLKRHGKRQDGENYLRRCLETPTTHVGLKRIADADLRRSLSSAGAVPTGGGQAQPR